MNQKKGRSEKAPSCFCTYFRSYDQYDASKTVDRKSRGKYTCN